MPALFPVSMTASGTKPGTKRLCLLYRPTVPVLSRTVHLYRDQTDNQGKVLDDVLSRSDSGAFVATNGKVADVAARVQLQGDRYLRPHTYSRGLIPATS